MKKLEFGLPDGREIVLPRSDFRVRTARRYHERVNASVCVNVSESKYVLLV